MPGLPMMRLHPDGESHGSPSRNSNSLAAEVIFWLLARPFLQMWRIPDLDIPAWTFS